MEFLVTLDKLTDADIKEDVERFQEDSLDTGAIKITQMMHKELGNKQHLLEIHYIGENRVVNKILAKQILSMYRKKLARVDPKATIEYVKKKK